MRKTVCELRPRMEMYETATDGALQIRVVGPGMRGCPEKPSVNMFFGVNKTPCGVMCIWMYECGRCHL